MRFKQIVALTFDGRKDKELLAKLNAVAPYARKKSHTLARIILLQKLNELITEYGIDISEHEAQPSVG